MTPVFRPAVWLFFLFLAMLLLPGQGQARTMTVTDAAGRAVTVPVDPHRILCLGPGCLRLVVYLEAQDRVVGIEGFEISRKTGRPYNLAHPGLLSRPVIGPGGPQSINKEPDLEAVLATNPQVIFASAMEAATANGLTDKLGIPVVVISYGAFARYDPRVFDSLALMGSILGREERARAVADFMREAEADVRQRAARGQAAPGFVRPTVYVGGTGLRGSHGLTSTDHPYPPLDWLSADNLASRVVDEGHAFVDKEQLLAFDPDILFVDASGLTAIADDFRQNPDYARSFKALVQGRAYVLYPFTSYLTNLETIVADAYAAGKILYPEAFADIDAPSKADAVYAFMVGRPVYGEMVRNYGPLGQPFTPLANGSADTGDTK
ncbi:ABC transporter substrate-binding protein [Solidesulfovibrio sp.]